jgi:hypothetical protein
MTRQQTHRLYTYLANDPLKVLLIEIWKERLSTWFMPLLLSCNLSNSISDFIYRCQYTLSSIYQVCLALNSDGSSSPSHLTAILSLLPYPNTMVPFGKHTQRCATNMTATNNFILDRWKITSGLLSGKQVWQTQINKSSGLSSVMSGVWN